MGLSISLYRKSIDEKDIILSKLNDEELLKEVAYWKNEYSINRWFAERLCADNCEEVECSKEDLEDFKIFLDEELRWEDDEWRDTKEHIAFVEEQIKLIQKIIDETDWVNETIIFSYSF